MTFKKGRPVDMATRRGRPPKSPEQRKEIQISVRLTTAVVAELRDAAKANGVPVAREVAIRLESSLHGNPYQIELFGGPKTHAFALLLALTLKHLRNRTGHWWHENRFTFEHARAAADQLFEFLKPRGKLVTPSDLPPPLAGQVRYFSGGVPYQETPFGREAAAELFGAVMSYSTEYGRMIELLPEHSRKPYQFDMDLYSRLGRELMPFARRREIGIRRKAKLSGLSRSPAPDRQKDA